MKVRLGYVAICNALNVTSSSPYNYSDYLKYNDFHKLEEIIISNLMALNKIIDYNIKNNIHFYRISSKLIPLATKDDVNFDYIYKYKKYYNKIGKKIRDSKMRVDFHPDQYCILNSVKEDVVYNSIKILEYHYKLLDALGINDKVLILHVGSSTFGKDNLIKRFINSYNKLPLYLKKCIAIENDDKVFNVSDVIKISNNTGIPIVLDYHHHMCNKSNIDINAIFDSWGDKVPKVHFSSPRGTKDFRSNNDYINGDNFICFIEFLKKYDRDVDIMLEAKCKDDSLFRLVRYLKYKTTYNFIDDTSFVL